MGTTLELKLRKRSDSVRVPTELLINWFKLSDEDTKERLYTFFSPYLEGDAEIHDKVFLENIINWTPVDEQSGRQKGLPLTEQVRWIKLAQKIQAVDESEDGEIILANKDIDAIMKRIKDPAYKVVGLSQPFTEFLTNFLKTTHQWFDDFDPSKDDEDEEEKEGVELSPELKGEGIAAGRPVEENEDGRERTEKVTA